MAWPATPVQCKGSFAGLVTAWRQMVEPPFKAGVLDPQVKTLG